MILGLIWSVRSRVSWSTWLVQGHHCRSHSPGPGCFWYSQDLLSRHRVHLEIVKHVNADPTAPPHFRVLTVNLDGLSSHLPGSNWGWGAPGTMSYLVPILHYKSTDPWVGYTPTSQALVRGPGWKPPLDFFDSNSQGLSHLGKLGLTDPECGSIMARVLERGRQRKS